MIRSGEILNYSYTLNYYRISPRAVFRNQYLMNSDSCANSIKEKLDLGARIGCSWHFSLLGFVGGCASEEPFEWLLR